VGVSLLIVPKIFPQTTVSAIASPPPGQATTGGTAEVERVIVTGSNIPTAEETGPNPVDTYRPADIEKLGIRNSTDLLTNLPQEMGATVNQNVSQGGDGSVIPNLRGLLPKETLVLIDGNRVAINGFGGILIGNSGGATGVDINLIPFPMIDHIDILKDGASAVYGSDAVAGVINFFLVHKFRGLETGGSYGNTNLGASNDMGEWEGWLKAGTGDDKTDIVVIADFYDRAAIYSRDRQLETNAFAIPWGGFEFRSGNEPGAIGTFPGFRLIPKLFFSANSPPPHSAPNAATSPYYVNPFVIAPNAYPGPPGINNPRVSLPQTLPGYGYKGGGDYFFYNFLADTPEIPATNRQSYYGSFMRDVCDKYLTVFADFKYTRSFFDAALAPTPFSSDAFNGPNGLPFSRGSISVPIQNPFNPFTVANATLIYNGVPIPVTTGVRYRAINDQGVRTDKTTVQDMLFDTGVRGEMGEFGDYFKDWNWELAFRYSRNDEEAIIGGVVSQSGLRQALLDTDPATAFNPFLGFFGRNSNAAISKVYVTEHQSGEFELPLGYFTLNGDLFNLPGGPVSFAAGGEYRGERWKNEPDSESATFDTIGVTDVEGSQVNRDVWAVYQEVRFPLTSPLWNFLGAYSLEFDVAEREEWYSQNTSAVLPIGNLVFVPAHHSQYNAQKPKFSVRWQPLDPKWIGTLTLRGSYSEAFHAPTLPDLSPAGTESGALFPENLHDPKGLTPPGTSVPVIVSGNPSLTPEVAYEWTYGAVYSPKFVKGLTLSTDYWHTDLRSIASFVGGQFILDFESSFPGSVIRDPTTGAITELLNPSLNLTRAIVEGVDYEGIYILDSSIFGHGDFGRLTFTLDGTYLSRFEFQATPLSRRVGLSGGFVSDAAFSGSLPHNRAYASAFYDGATDTWLAGFDTGATVHYTGQYEDDNILLTGSSKQQEPRSGPLPWRARKVSEWVTLDLIASYTFNLPPPASAAVPGLAKDGGKNVKMRDGKEKNTLPVSTAEYNPCGWRGWLNNTTLTLGIQNVFDSDPPFVAGAAEVYATNFDQSLATIKGRFWYIQLRKRF
jgi:iron complex outermembrane receptor protein